MMVPQDRGLEGQHYKKFHDRFTSKKDVSFSDMKQKYGELNSASINDRLRTRPTNKVNYSLQKERNEDYVPSVQGFNRRGKLY